MSVFPSVFAKNKLGFLGKVLFLISFFSQIKGFKGFEAKFIFKGFKGSPIESLLGSQTKELMRSHYENTPIQTH